MGNYKVTANYKPSAGGSGLITSIGDYVAGSAEGSKEFTISGVDFDTHSYILVVFDGSITAAAAVLMQLNGQIGSDYRMDGRRLTAAVETLLENNAGTSHELCSNTLCSQADDSFVGEVKIYHDQASGTIITSFIGDAYGKTQQIDEHHSGCLNIAVTSLTTIKILTSTSTWKTGTRISVYKVSRS